MTDTVIILGASGLFGGLLARQLLATGRWDVVCAGRDAGKLAAFCSTYGGRPYAFDRDDPAAVAAALATIVPFAVVDAAGPFQNYGPDPYAFARAVIASGAHYLDIADASQFVAGFATLDDLARARRVTALSGASSTPALSAAAVRALAEGLEVVEQIETAILPGNRTPRGLAVMRAILGQVGQPLRLWRDGMWRQERGWSGTRRYNIRIEGHRPIRNRLASLVDTPDLLLFPQHFKARSVSFRAGLELPLFHHALGIAGRLVAAGLLASLEPFARLALGIASSLQHRGSDRGGMIVEVTGTTAEGGRERRCWQLLVADGHGPKIPVQPAAVLLEKLRSGALALGARACLEDLVLEEVEEAMRAFGVLTQRSTMPLPSLFQRALGSAFSALPTPIRHLHAGFGCTTFAGEADVDGPQGMLAWLSARIAGFPRAGRRQPVRVVIEAEPQREIWTRHFARRAFRSVMTLEPRTERVRERFGPFSFTLGIERRGDELHYPVLAGRLFDIIPLPPRLLPHSLTREYEDERGRFCFDVLVRMRSGERIAHYRGWLLPVDNAGP